MELTRTELIDGTTASVARFEELLRSLDDAAWHAPTRCEGWVVADVAAHVAGTLTAVATGALDDFADPAHVDRHVAARTGHSPGEIADEIQGSAKISRDLISGIDQATWDGPSPAGLSGTLGEGVEAIWYDAYVHHEDILAALGRPPLRGPDMRVAVIHIARELDRQGWGPATLAFDGVPEVTVGGGAGGDRRLTGDALAFILAATGRTDPSALGLDETVNIYRPQ